MLVTTMSMIAVSGSIRNPMLTLKLPETIQLKTSILIVLPPATSAKVIIESANDPNTARIEIQWARSLMILFPRTILRTNAISGNIMMRM
jgi:hypothetical protein